MPNLKTTLTAAATTSIAALLNAPFIQTIWHVKVRPAARSVRLSFNTMHDCVPAIELYLDSPSMSFALMEKTTAYRIVWPFLGGLRSYHFVEFDDLPENTTFWFKISAYADEKITPGMKPAYQLGMFTTGRRAIDITVNALEIWRDGDEMSDGDLYFSFRAINLETGWAIDRKRLPEKGRTSYTDGSVQKLTWHLKAQNAPDLIAVETYALDDDSHLFNPGLSAIGEGPQIEPYFPPQTPERKHIRRDVSDMATTRDIFRIPDIVGQQTIGFMIDSGYWEVLWYKFFGKIEVTTTASPRAPVIFSTIDSKPRAGIIGGFQGIVAGNGQSATIPGHDKAPELRIGIAGNGRVFWYGPRRPRGEEVMQLGSGSATQTSETNMPSPQAPSQQTPPMHSLPGIIAGPLTVLTDPEGGHDLFAADAQGHVHRARLDIDSKAVGEWRELGGSAAGKLTALRLDDGRVALFATDANGAVNYRLLQRHAERGSKWFPLGGHFRSIAAHDAGKGRLHLIGLDADGAAHYLQITLNREASRAPRWKPIGGKSLIAASFILTEDGALAAFAIDAQRRLSGKIWQDRRWQPADDTWLAMGELDRLAYPDPFTTPRGRHAMATATAKSNGNARVAKTQIKKAGKKTNGSSRSKAEAQRAAH